MQRKTITITKQQEDWVRSQLDAGRFGNESEYFRHLIRIDQKRCLAEYRLGEIVDEAIASGISEKSLDDAWRDALAKVKR